MILRKIGYPLQLHRPTSLFQKFMSAQVTRNMTTNNNKEHSELVRPDLANYCPASNLAFNERIRALIKAGETIYHFGFGQSPFPVPKVFTEGLKDHSHENAYLPVAGIPELRQAVVDFHRKWDKLDNLDPDRVIVGPGTKELIFLLLSVFNGNVLIVSPTWTTYYPQSQLAHHKPIIVNTTYENEWRLTTEDIEKAYTENKLSGYSILILCNPCNPTGTHYKVEHMEELAKTLRKRKIIVMSDEIYSRLHYDDDHHTLATSYPEGVILSSGFSKWASAGGWRIGYHMYPKELVPLLNAVKSAASHTFSCAPAPMQYGVVKGLRQEEACDNFIRHTTRIMKAAGYYCHRELTSIGVRAVRPNAGYYMFPDFEICGEKFAARGITTGEQMCAAMLDECKVALMAGGPAFLRPLEEFTVRLCFVCFDGDAALKKSREIGLDKELPDTFVQEFAQPVHDGIQALKKWVLQQLES